MRSHLLAGLTLGLVLIFAGIAAADKAEEVKALVDKAVAMAKEDGLEKTYKVINDRKGLFVKGDLYVFAGDFEKISATAHPFLNSMILGSDLTNFKDPKGNQVFLMMSEIVKKSGEGWVDYCNRQPTTGKVASKRGYVKRVPETTVYMGCGYFPKK